MAVGVMSTVKVLSAKKMPCKLVSVAAAFWSLIACAYLRLVIDLFAGPQQCDVGNASALAIVVERILVDAIAKLGTKVEDPELLHDEGVFGDAEVVLRRWWCLRDVEEERSGRREL